MNHDIEPVASTAPAGQELPARFAAKALSRSLSPRFWGVAVAAVMTLAPVAASAEQTGTSCADCPSYSGAFSVENNTGRTIHYEYRWGENHPWKKMSLASGIVETHSYPLGDDVHGRAPVPFVRFDRIGGDNGVTWREYRMQFHAVGYAGFGPAQNRARAKPYVFRYSANGRDIDLLAKQQ